MGKRGRIKVFWRQMTPDIDIDIDMDWKHPWERKYTTINGMTMWFKDTGDGKKRKAVSNIFFVCIEFFLSLLSLRILECCIELSLSLLSSLRILKWSVGYDCSWELFSRVVNTNTQSTILSHPICFYYDIFSNIKLVLVGLFIFITKTTLYLISPTLFLSYLLKF